MSFRKLLRAARPKAVEKGIRFGGSFGIGVVMGALRGGTAAKAIPWMTGLAATVGGVALRSPTLSTVGDTALMAAFLSLGGRHGFGGAPATAPVAPTTPALARSVDLFRAASRSRPSLNIPPRGSK